MIDFPSSKIKHNHPLHPTLTVCSLANRHNTNSKHKFLAHKKKHTHNHQYWKFKQSVDILKALHQNQGMPAIEPICVYDKIKSILFEGKPGPEPQNHTKFIPMQTRRSHVEKMHHILPVTTHINHSVLACLPAAKSSVERMLWDAPTFHSLWGPLVVTQISRGHTKFGKATEVVFVKFRPRC